MDSNNDQRHDEFVRLLVKNQRRIHGFILTLLPRGQDAEDALQEASLVAWKKFDSFEIGTDFARWACTIARYEVLRIRSRQKASHLIFDDALVESLADRCSERGEVLDQLFSVLDECRKKLTPEDDDLLQRVYEDQASTKQVAEELGRPVDSIYKALSRIRRSLAKCIRFALAALERTP